MIAGCDGFHGVCRAVDPGGVLRDVRARVPVRLARHPRARSRRRSTSSSTRTASAASRCSRCARRELSRYYVQWRTTRTSTLWPDEPHLGGAAARGTAARRLDARRRGRSSRRASPACAASSSSRCSTGGSSSPATPRTSSRRRARRGSTSRSTTCGVLAEALVRLVRERATRACSTRYSDDVPAAGLALRALLVVDDDDAAPAPRATTPFDLQLQLSQLRYVTTLARRPRPRSRRTTWESSTV